MHPAAVAVRDSTGRSTHVSPSRPDRRPMLLRPLMWAHLTLLCSLPVLAYLACGFVEHASPLRAVVFGFAPGVAFVAVLAASYRVPDTAVGTLLLVLAVPAQVGASALLFDAGAWGFLVEEAFVEAGALSVGLTVAMLVYRPSGASGARVGVLMAA